MTLKDLQVIYDRKFSQAGDTEQDFYKWAIDYLLQKKLDTKTIKRHIKGIEKAIETLEKE
jgi:hypothetical protein